VDRPGPHRLDGTIETTNEFVRIGFEEGRVFARRGNYCFMRVGTLGQFILVCIQVAHLRNNP
jgi:hypothetical protein